MLKEYDDIKEEIKKNIIINMFDVIKVILLSEKRLTETIIKDCKKLWFAWKII